jgi:FMN-dependent NADH-azoreductase
MGITAVETVYAEGLNMGEGKRASALDEARSAIKQLLTVDLPEVRYAIA